MNQPLLTVPELSSFLHIHPKTLYRWTDERKLPFVKINGLIRFDRKEIEGWQDSNKENIPKFPPFHTKIDFSLAAYDKMLLKGGNVLSKNSKRWNYGFGSIYTRKTKQGRERWYIDFKDSGKRIRQVVESAKSRAEAVKVLQEKVSEAFNKVYNPDAEKSKTTFQKLADSYLNDYAKANKKSWKDDEYRIEAHMRPFFGVYELSAITPLLIEKYRVERLNAGITKSTVNREITIMKKMFNLAIDWRLTRDNPVVKVRLFSEKDTQKERILTEEEEARLLAESPGYLRPILVVALNTGMRRGEILNLKWEQVDLTRRIIKVQHTKSGKSRIIPINDVLLNAFLELERLDRGNVWVFPNPNTGLPYTEVKKSFKAACKRAGIVGLRFHDMRHTVATRLIESGVDIITVRDLLGHFSVRVTQRYTHSNQNQKVAAVQRLAKKDSKMAKNEEGLAHICHIGPGGNLRKSLNVPFSVN